MSFRCCRGRRPRLRGNALPPAARPVAALPRLTQRLGRRSFLSCGVIGWRAGGAVRSAVFLSRSQLAFPVSRGYPYGHSPNYHIRRADGTTAAERFFGRAHETLFAQVLQRMPLPTTPTAQEAALPDAGGGVAALAGMMIKARQTQGLATRTAYGENSSTI